MRSLMNYIFTSPYIIKSYDTIIRNKETWHGICILFYGKYNFGGRNEEK